MPALEALTAVRVARMLFFANIVADEAIFRIPEICLLFTASLAVVTSYAAATDLASVLCVDEELASVATSLFWVAVCVAVATASIFIVEEFSLTTVALELRNVRR
jgi:hypothetical protein